MGLKMFMDFEYRNHIKNIARIIDIGGMTA